MVIKEKKEKKKIPWWYQNTQKQKLRVMVYSYNWTLYSYAREKKTYACADMGIFWRRIKQTMCIARSTLKEGGML